MSSPIEQQSPRYTIRQRVAFCAGFGVFCMVFTVLVAVLPLYLILANTSPPDYGTEAEAILFAEDVVNERLGRPKDERIDWEPTAKMKHPLPPLNQEKRLWNIVGKVVIDAKMSRKYHVSAYKEPTGQWALVGVHVDDRTIYFDKKILEAPLPEWYDDPAAWESPIH